MPKLIHHSLQIQYNSCIHLVHRVAQKVGYNPNKVIFVPVSAIKDDNVTTATSNMAWYDNWETVSRPGNHVTGVTLLDALHKTQQPTRMNSKPLRVPIHTVYKLGCRLAIYLHACTCNMFSIYRVTMFF